MKFYKDFFVYKKNHYWFIIPTIVFYFDRYEIYDDRKMAPCWGFTFRWLLFMVGFQIQHKDES